MNRKCNRSGYAPHQHLQDHRKNPISDPAKLHPGTVAGMQGIGELHDSRGSLNSGLDLRDRIEVSRLHGIELECIGQYDFHALPPHAGARHRFCQLCRECSAAPRQRINTRPGTQTRQPKGQPAAWQGYRLHEPALLRNALLHSG